MNIKKWITEAIAFGVIMFIIYCIIELVAGEITFDKLWLKFLLWLIGGLVYGILVNLIRTKRES
jgi:uncharacterized membrane protein (DUF441 family)